MVLHALSVRARCGPRTPAGQQFSLGRTANDLLVVICAPYRALSFVDDTAGLGFATQNPSAGDVSGVRVVSKRNSILLDEIKDAIAWI